MLVWDITLVADSAKAAFRSAALEFVRRAFMAVHGSVFCNPVEEESTQKGT